MDKKFELRLSDGRVVTWQGIDGHHAATRYADAHPDVVIVAWREQPFGVFPASSQQIVG